MPVGIVRPLFGKFAHDTSVARQLQLRGANLASSALLQSAFYIDQLFVREIRYHDTRNGTQEPSPVLILIVYFFCKAQDIGEFDLFAAVKHCFAAHPSEDLMLV